MGRPKQRVSYTLLNGGLATNPTDPLVSQDPSGQLESEDIQNSVFEKVGAIGKRLGSSQQGNDIASATWDSQLTDNGTESVSGNSTTIAFCQKIDPAPSDASIISVTVRLSKGLVDIFGDLKCVIKDDNAGDPGSTVTNGESNAIAGSTLGTAATDVTFTFSTPPSLTIAGDPYWFCIQGDSSNVGTLTIQVDTAGTGMKETNDNYSSFTASTGDMYYVIKEQDNAATVNGIFDYQLEASGSLSQKIVVAVGGSIYVKNGSSWDELKDTLASGQDAIYDFKTANNYMFSTDYANNNNRCWNGTTAGTTTQSTMDHGYRATFTATRTAGS